MRQQPLLSDYGTTSARSRAEQGQLKRIKAAIPLVAQLRRLSRQLDELGDVVRLRDDFGAEFRKARDQHGRAEYTISKAKAAIQEIDAQLDRLDPPRSLLDVANEIELLQERLGAVEKAKFDRMKVEQFQQEAEHQARASFES